VGPAGTCPCPCRAGVSPQKEAPDSSFPVDVARSVERNTWAQAEEKQLAFTSVAEQCIADRVGQVTVKVVVVDSSGNFQLRVGAR